MKRCKGRLSRLASQTPADCTTCSLPSKQWTPSDYKIIDTGLEIRWGVHGSRFGDVLVAATDRGICELNFVDDDDEAAVDILRGRWSRALLRRDRATMRSYAERLFEPPGSSPNVQFKLWIKGTNFQIKVWETSLRIPFGSLASCGGLALAMDRPEAAARLAGRSPTTPWPI